MLVLSRMKDESIFITIPPSDKPREVVMTVVDIRGDKVRLGVDAPLEIGVNRQEVHEAIKREESRRAKHVNPQQKVEGESNNQE